MDQLLEKLMISKKIMDKHESIGRGNTLNSNTPSNMVESFNVPQAKYNIPAEFLQQSQQAAIPQAPINTGTPSIDAIKKSRLPDDIKKLMIEHPIEKPQQHNLTLSNDLIEKASRLMKEQSNNYVPESAQPKETKKVSTNQSPDLKKMIKEAVEETLREHGVISESSEKTNEVFSFRVGKHIFEGKVTKVKKIS